MTFTQSEDQSNPLLGGKQRKGHTNKIPIFSLGTSGCGTAANGPVLPPRPIRSLRRSTKPGRRPPPPPWPPPSCGHGLDVKSWAYHGNCYAMCERVKWVTFMGHATTKWRNEILLPRTTRRYVGTLACSARKTCWRPAWGLPEVSPRHAQSLLLLDSIATW